MRKHKALRGLSVVLVLAALLMFTGDWVALKKEYRRECLQAALEKLEDLSDQARALFYQAEAEGSLSAKDMGLALQTTRARAIDILEDGALTPPEGQFLLRKTVSIAGELSKLPAKYGGQGSFRRAVEAAYPHLFRARAAYMVLYAAAIVLPLITALQHLLKKRGSGVPALLCYLAWSGGAAAAVYAINHTVFFTGVLTITAYAVLAPLCMFISVILWRRGYKLYLREHEAAVFASIDGGTEARRHIVIRPPGGACPRCGRALAEGDEICPECGEPLREPETAEGQNKADPPEDSAGADAAEDESSKAVTEPSQPPEPNAGPEPRGNPEAPGSPETAEEPETHVSPQDPEDPGTPKNPAETETEKTPEDPQVPQNPQAAAGEIVYPNSQAGS